MARLVIKQRHKPWVSAVAWSPDGQQVVSVCEERAQVWDVATGKIRVTHPIGGSGVVWFPDGARIATAGVGWTVDIWDARTGKTLLTSTGHTEGVEALALSPDGSRMASASFNSFLYSEPVVQVWDTATGQQLLSYTQHTDRIMTLAWSPDGKYLASAGDAGIVRVWEATTGTDIGLYQGHAQEVQGSGTPNRIAAVAWSPDGQRLVSTNPVSVRIWEAMTGQTLLTAPYPTWPVFGGPVAWSPDGTRIASLVCKEYDAKVVQVWNSDTGETSDSYTGHTRPIATLAWSPDGRCIASGGQDRTTQVWEPQ
jgi:dipeptidyl aminopeptidase/acylaminoacyl peptidase